MVVSAASVRQAARVQAMAGLVPVVMIAQALMMAVTAPSAPSARFAPGVPKTISHSANQNRPVFQPVIKEAVITGCLFFDPPKPRNPLVAPTRQP